MTGKQESTTARSEEAGHHILYDSSHCSKDDAIGGASNWCYWRAPSEPTEIAMRNWPSTRDKLYYSKFKRQEEQSKQYERVEDLMRSEEENSNWIDSVRNDKVLSIDAITLILTPRRRSYMERDNYPYQKDTILVDDHKSKQIALIIERENPVLHTCFIQMKFVSFNTGLIMVHNLPEEFRMMRLDIPYEEWNGRVWEEFSADHITVKWLDTYSNRERVIRAADKHCLLQGRLETIGCIPYRLFGNTLLVTAGSIVDILNDLAEAGGQPHGQWHISA